jgi:hypothetical protein
MKTFEPILEKLQDDLNADIRPWVQIGEALINSETLAKLVRDDGAICYRCARERGAKWPDGHQATHWMGECCVCGKTVGCCAVSDWNWPNVTGRKADREF